ncbi:ABC transporter substrate-binding protein [Haloarcula salina]|uniref:ABC transporter substrate-binding protein n=1 Tax=Haloarcula salina TaxID=1429914 RepID=A0AA41G0W4_9EURY|nr:ABC transporter substrate-binding protein [Haloarcula salina]MBV0901338.1 ABC transporter substrate-binding protein [Haloarcula salina]
MDDDSARGERLTRREYLGCGGAVVGGGLLAGCSGAGDTDGTASESATGRSTPASGTPSETAATDGSYSVTMEPVGKVEFDGPPESWFSYTADYADMGVALGQAEGLSAIGVRERFGTHYYDDLSGVAVESDDLTQLWQDGTGKEVFYELDAGLHVVDPNFVVNRLGWDRDDVAEVESTVAPFFGNTIFSRAYDWHDYTYYSLYEAFEKLAAVFDERARYEAFKSHHDEVVSSIRSRLPSTTPDLALLYPAEMPPESFYPYLVGDGTQSKQWRDLGVNDALAEHGVTDAQAGGGTIDYETLLEIDPDAIAVRIQGEISEAYFTENVATHMEDHEVASALTAVQNDRVFYGGLTYQGPIIHLFQLERAARGLYPDEFGGEELFDRQRIADIVTGRFDR